MEITCAQMDVLLSFYIEGDLSKALKSKVEEHLKECSACRAKYEIVKSMLKELRSTVEDKEEVFSPTATSQYRIFKNNLSAYIDNELPAEESIKIKKTQLTTNRHAKSLKTLTTSAGL